MRHGEGWWPCSSVRAARGEVRLCARGTPGRARAHTHTHTHTALSITHAIAPSPPKDVPLLLYRSRVPLLPSLSP